MKTITIREGGTFEVPKEHKLSKENRVLSIRGENFTSFERLLKGDIQTQTQMWFREKPRKTHKGLLEINGVFYKIKLNDAKSKDQDVSNEVIEND